MLANIGEILASNLPRLRKQAGFTSQAALAEKAEIPFRTYQDIERGINWPERKNLQAIAAALGVEEHVLLQTPNEVEEIYRELLTILASLDEAQLRAVLSVARAAADGSAMQKTVNPRK